MNMFAKPVTAFALLLSLSVGCGDDRACAIDSDCFDGEFCSREEVCVAGSRVDNAPTGNNGTTNNGNPNNGTTGANNGSTTNGPGVGGTCAVDPIGNTCFDDTYEDNDLYTQTAPVPIRADSWCLDGELAQNSQTFEGTLCPGDQADLFRLLIDNRQPHECLNDRFTLKVTVELDRACDPDALLRMFPYHGFENPILNSPCGQREELRCTVSEDLKTYTFEWAWDSEQMPSPYLNIQPREDYVQTDYTVTVEIIQ